MEKYSEWKNTTSGHLGVVKHDDEGKPRGISVRPGGTVLLSEKDRVATANAPQNPANNPFQNGALVCIAAEAELSTRRPIGDAREAAPDPQPEPTPEPPAEPPQEPQGETGAAPAPEGDPPQGQAAPHEEAAAVPPVPEVSVETVEPAAPAPEPVQVHQEGDPADPTPPPPTPTPTPTPPTPTPQQ